MTLERKKEILSHFRDYNIFLKKIKNECDFVGEYVLNYTKTANKILKAINELPDLYEVVMLTMYYVHGFSVEEISGCLCYSERHCIRIHKRAIEHINLQEVEDVPTHKWLEKNK